MQMKSKVVAVLIGSMALFAASTAGAQQYVRIAASSTGGSWYPLGAKIAEIISSNIEGVSATVGPGGGVSNVQDVSNGEAEIGWTFSHTSYDGYVGRGPFKKKYDNVRFLAALYPAAFQAVVREDSNIKSLADLKGKRVSPGKPKWSSYDTFKSVIGSYGYNVDDLKSAGGVINHVSYSESVGLMKDGNIDAFTTVTNVPQASFLELEQSMKIRFLPFDGENRAKFLKERPGYIPVTIDSSAYKSLKKPFDTIGARTILVVNKDMPDELVYKITKLLWEKHADLLSVKKIWSKVALKDGLSGASIPVHPGAAKFYKEKGVSAQ